MTPDTRDGPPTRPAAGVAAGLWCTRSRGLAPPSPLREDGVSPGRRRARCVWSGMPSCRAPALGRDGDRDRQACRPTGGPDGTRQSVPDPKARGVGGPRNTSVPSDAPRATPARRFARASLEPNRRASGTIPPGGCPHLPGRSHPTVGRGASTCNHWEKCAHGGKICFAMGARSNHSYRIASPGMRSF